MTQTTLDVRAKKSLIQIADTLADINQKLDHIIRKQTADFFFSENFKRGRVE